MDIEIQRTPDCGLWTHVLGWERRLTSGATLLQSQVATSAKQRLGSTLRVVITKEITLSPPAFPQGSCSSDFLEIWCRRSESNRHGE